MTLLRYLNKCFVLTAQMLARNECGFKYLKMATEADGQNCIYKTRH